MYEVMEKSSNYVGRYNFFVVDENGVIIKKYRFKQDAERKCKELNMACSGLNEAKAALEAARCCEISKYICPTAVSTYESTACCAPCTPNYPAGFRPKTEEKESTMNYGYETANLETQQRNHLKRRLDDAFYTLKSALKTKYNINYDASPKTLDELKRKLAASEIVIDESQFDATGKYNGWAGILSTIKFIDPTKVEDEAGYKAARKDLETKLQSAKDIALVAPLADGLKALQDFEATAI